VSESEDGMPIQPRRTFLGLRTLAVRIAATVGAIAVSADADTIYVEPPQLIQVALSQAQPGDTVVLADGVYSGFGNRDLDFGGKAITLRSENGPAYCVIDGLGTHRLIVLDDDEGPDTVIEGVTFRNGFGAHGGAIFGVDAVATVRDCVFELNDAAGYGGAIRFERVAAPPIPETAVEGCIFRENRCGEYGGGIAVSSLDVDLRDCRFEANESAFRAGAAYFGGGAGSSLTDVAFEGNISVEAGGGLYMDGSNGNVISRVRFIGNESGDAGGGAYLDSTGLQLSQTHFERNVSGNDGGGLFIDDEATVTDGTFINNTAGNDGGGIYVSGPEPTLVRLRVTGNTTPDDGGGIYISSGVDATLQDLLIAMNTAGSEGGGLYLSGSPGATATNVTIAENDAPQAGRSVDISSSSSLSMGNSIVWNSTEGADELSGAITAQYSIIKGGLAGTANLDADPLFVAATGGVFTLGAGSPAIDSGDSSLVSCRDPDLAGNWRRADVPAAEDTGVGRFPIVDRGCFETNAGPPTDCNGNGFPDLCDLDFNAIEDSDGDGLPDDCEADPACAADLDGSGVVDSGDLFLVLGHWGAAGPGDLAPRGGDGTVDLIDVLAILDAWSTVCPP
jgi:predicted outer membrane repeat protein